MRMLIVVAAEVERRAVEAGILAAKGGGAAGMGVEGAETTTRLGEPGYPENSRLGEPGYPIGVVETGVGKVNAALGVVEAMAGGAWEVVVNLGIGGALPVGRGGAAGVEVAIGDVVVGAVSAYGDEGVGLPGGEDGAPAFSDIAAMGFPPLKGMTGVGFSADAELVAWVRGALERAGVAAREGTIATVSMCSGTDALARGVAGRTGAVVEGMEGAAVAHAVGRMGRMGREGIETCRLGEPAHPEATCRLGEPAHPKATCRLGEPAHPEATCRLGESAHPKATCRLGEPAHHGAVKFVEVRVVSNTTGDRPKQVWEMKRALAGVSRVAEALARAAVE